MKVLILASLLLGLLIFGCTSQPKTQGEIWMKQTTSNDLDILGYQWTYYYPDKGLCDMQIKLQSNWEGTGLWYYFTSPSSSYPATQSSEITNAFTLTTGSSWITRNWVPANADTITVCYLRGKSLDPQEMHMYEKCKSFAIDTKCSPDTVVKQ